MRNVKVERHWSRHIGDTRLQNFEEILSLDRNMYTGKKSVKTTSKCTNSWEAKKKPSLQKLVGYQLKQDRRKHREQSYHTVTSSEIV